MVEPYTCFVGGGTVVEPFKVRTPDLFCFVFTVYGSHSVTRETGTVILCTQGP